MTEEIDGGHSGLTEVVVAAGRTVTTKNEWRHEKTRALTAQGVVDQFVKVTDPGGETSYGPGETVHLPHDEAARLEVLGFVARPGAAQNSRPLGNVADIHLPPHDPLAPGLVSSRTQ